MISPALAALFFPVALLGGLGLVFTVASARGRKAVEKATTAAPHVALCIVIVYTIAAVLLTHLPVRLLGVRHSSVGDIAIAVLATALGLVGAAGILLLELELVHRRKRPAGAVAAGPEDPGVSQRAARYRTSAPGRSGAPGRARTAGQIHAAGQTSATEQINGPERTTAPEQIAASRRAGDRDARVRSLTAGRFFLAEGILFAVAEEVLWRGIGVLLVQQMWAGTAPKVAVYIAGILLFGLCHANFGLRAIAVKAVAGAVWTGLALLAGGLVPVFVSHIVYQVLVQRWNRRGWRRTSAAVRET